MRLSFVVLAFAAFPAVANAQSGWTPGAEIVGQPVQVTTNGVTNTVILEPGGTARIMTPAGRAVPAQWSTPTGQLCLTQGSAQECWPYGAPFHAATPITLTSSCSASSTWLASATNGPPPPAASERGERGR